MLAILLRRLPGLVLAILLSCGSLLAQDPSRQVTTSKHRYWTDTAAGAIWQSSLDGSFAKIVVADLKGPYGLSLDPIAGVLLWTNSEEGTVGRFDPATGQSVTLKSEFEEPYAIVLDEETRTVAYAVAEGNVVKVVQEDYSETESFQILVPGETEPLPIAAPKAGTGSVEVDGSLEDPPPPIHGLALDSDVSSTDAAFAVLYIGDGYGMMARRVRLADSRVDALIFDDGPATAAPSREVVK